MITRIEQDGPDPDDIDLWAMPDGGGEERRVGIGGIQVPVEDLPRFRARARRAHEQRMRELSGGPISIPNDPPVDPAIYEASIKWGESEADATVKVESIRAVLKEAGFVDDRAAATRLYAEGHSDQIRVWLKNDRAGVVARDLALVRASPLNGQPINTTAPALSSATEQPPTEVTREEPDPAGTQGGGVRRVRGPGRPRQRAGR